MTQPNTEKQPEKMLVLNHDARMYRFPIGATRRSVWLRPGANFIDQSDWAAVMKTAVPDELVGFLVADGRVEQMGAQDPSLEGMSGTKAIAIVKKTLDRKLLSRWGDVELRPSVQKAIDVQLSAIDGSKSA